MIENICLCCGKRIRLECSLFEMLYQNDVICESCRGKLDYWPKRIRIGKYNAIGLYPYQGIFRDMMIQYKEYNDEALKSIFLYKQIDKLKQKYKGYVIVPIPSSQENLAQRGFNQVIEMFSFLELPIREVLIKTENISQKQLNYKERKNIGKALAIKNAISIEGKRVLLVDDILTTGSTLKAAIRLIEPVCKSIEIIAVGYNKTYLNALEKLIQRVKL